MFSIKEKEEHRPNTGMIYEEHRRNTGMIYEKSRQATGYFV